MASPSARPAPAAPARTSRTPARSPSGSAIPHYVLDYESRFRAEVMDSLRRFLPARRDAGALHRLQSHGEVPRPAADGARARRRGAGDRPLRAARDGRGGARAASRRRSGARPELLPVRHDGRAARLPALSARATCPRARRARWPSASSSPVADKPDSQDICFVPNGDYACGGAEAPARGGRAGRDRRHGGPGRRPPRRHRALHRRPAPRPGAGRAQRHRQRPALCRAARARDAPRRRRPALARSAAARSRSTT